MNTWHFGIENDKLVELVLNGKKTATTSLYDIDKIPQVGEKSILIYNNEKKACITKVKNVIIRKFKDIDWDLALLEGENNCLEEWKKVHRDYFSTIVHDFDDNTQVIFEIFEVVENFTLKRLETAKKIVDSNKNIFGKIVSIKEINAGFNNNIFDVDDKFIIKVCDEISYEKQFEVESNFYVSNIDNKAIPKLYKYDNSKNIVPYVYEIIEKIKGKTVYYYWYKMNEIEREEFIKNLMIIIKELHYKDYAPYNWANKVKKQVVNNYNKCKELFNLEERNIIIESLALYERILSNNKFSLIHNDLHFDNILIDEKNNIKLIDFNDLEIAPFDYDLRLLYMSKEQPWKCANIEMDPYQKPKDYKNIFEYTKKYYTLLNNLKYLEERMIIYSILNDIKHLVKYKNSDLKERVLRNSRLLLSRISNN